VGRLNNSPPARGFAALSRARALGIAAAERSILEAGVPGFEFQSCISIEIVRAKTPAERQLPAGMKILP
jgi:hypothetical protein